MIFVVSQTGRQMSIHLIITRYFFEFNSFCAKEKKNIQLADVSDENFIIKLTKIH